MRKKKHYSKIMLLNKLNFDNTWIRNLYDKYKRLFVS